MKAKSKPRADRHPIVVMNLYRPEPMRFSDFAVDNNLVLVINEAGTEPEKYVAGFDEVVAAYMGMLVPVFGQGDTPDKAVADYRRKIKGHTLIKRPGSAVFREELVCPKTWLDDVN